MAFISKNMRVISLDELLKCLSGASVFPKNAVVVTFDDGYYDFYTNAYPILQKYKIPCTVFPVTSLLNQGIIQWEDNLALTVNRTKSKTLKIILNGKERTYNLLSSKGKLHCIRDLNDFLYERGEKERNRVLNELELLLGKSPNKPENLYLSWEQVKEIDMGGLVAFGSHTQNHRILTSLDKNTMGLEISNSKKELERMLNKPCTFFCYPHGKRRHFNVMVKELLKELGFGSAVTTIPGRVSKGSDPFELKRVIALDGSMYQFKCVLIGFTPQTS